MSTTSIDICSRALVMIGANPITSFEEGTTESRVAVTLYETTARDQLSRYRWRFAVGQVQLSRLTETPLAKWDAAYQLPATCLQPTTLLVADQPLDFDRYEDMLFCNASDSEPVYLDGIYRVDEQFWPPYFIALMELAMASHFALAIAAKPELADYLDKRALRHAAIARNADAQARTTPKINMGGILRFRRGPRGS